MSERRRRLYEEAQAHLAEQPRPPLTGTFTQAAPDVQDWHPDPNPRRPHRHTPTPHVNHAGPNLPLPSFPTPEYIPLDPPHHPHLPMDLSTPEFVPLDPPFAASQLDLSTPATHDGALHPAFHQQPQVFATHPHHFPQQQSLPLGHSPAHDYRPSEMAGVAEINPSPAMSQWPSRINPPPHASGLPQHHASTSHHFGQADYGGTNVFSGAGQYGLPGQSFKPAATEYPAPLSILGSSLTPPPSRRRKQKSAGPLHGETHSEHNAAARADAMAAASGIEPWFFDPHAPQGFGGHGPVLTQEMSNNVPDHQVYYGFEDAPANHPDGYFPQYNATSAAPQHHPRNSFGLHSLGTRQVPLTDRQAQRYGKTAREWRSDKSW